MIKNNDDDLKEFINNSDLSIVEMVGVKNVKKLEKISKDLNKLLGVIKVEFPNAQYIVTENHIKLFVGSHVDLNSIKEGGYGRISIKDNSELEVCDFFIDNMYMDIR